MSDWYQRLLEFTGDGVYRYSFADGRILMANRGLMKILDLDGSPEELVGKCLQDVLIYTEKPATIRHELETKGEIHGFEYHFQTLKGDDKWVLHDSFIVTDPETKQPVVEAIVKDITFRKHAEQALAAEKERLAVTLRSIGDGVIATDTGGRIVLLNQVAETLTGWPQAEAAGRLLPEVFHIINEQTRQRCVDPVERVLRSGGIVGMANHTALISRAGAERTIADSGAPIRDQSGQLLGVVLVFRDITDKQRTEEELRRHREHLEELVKERTAELARSNAELEQFAYVASHDLQEPLRTVANYVELLSRRYRGRLDADADEFIRFTVDAAHHMQHLIRDLLAFSRVGRAGRALGPTDCSAVWQSVLNNLQMAIEDSQAVVTCDPLPTVRGDSTQLIELLQNLLGNAIKFRGPQPPQIHVSARAEGGDWVFAVRDNGIGIDLKDTGRLFELFQRLHNRQQYPGTGIGLAICRKIVERHGGRIWVESEPAHGSTFCFTLPAVKET